MIENQVENRLKKRVMARGGKALKFISPGLSGVPDRLILFPGGKVIFVELKAPGEKPRPLQVKRAKELRTLGFQVYCLDSLIAVDEFIDEVFK